MAPVCTPSHSDSPCCTYWMVAKRGCCQVMRQKLIFSYIVNLVSPPVDHFKAKQNVDKFFEKIIIIHKGGVRGWGTPFGGIRNPPIHCPRRKKKKREKRWDNNDLVLSRVFDSSWVVYRNYSQLFESLLEFLKIL